MTTARAVTSHLTMMLLSRLWPLPFCVTAQRLDVFEESVYPDRIKKSKALGRCAKDVDRLPRVSLEWRVPHRVRPEPKQEEGGAVVPRKRSRWIVTGRT
jgi:hypothetical protein